MMGRSVPGVPRRALRTAVHLLRRGAAWAHASAQTVGQSPTWKYDEDFKTPFILLCMLVKNK